MKKIELKKLELINYRNIEHAVYEFNGNSKIVGDNRIGKTNTLEAIYYLLTGYLLNGSSDIQAIKPLTNQRAVVSVHGTFDVDGKTITIEKKYGEEWVKQRNTGEEVLKGHFSKLLYNGAQQATVRDFENLFNEDFGITPNDAVKVSFTQLLTNPFYLGDLCETKDWVEVRKFIIDLVGDVSDEDVFAKEPMLLMIKPELEFANGRIDQAKKKIDGEIKGLKETLIADEAKIEMLSKVTAPNEMEVSCAKIELKKIDTQIASLNSKAGNKEAELELKNRIADINLKIAEASAVKPSEATTELINNRNVLFDKKVKIQNKISELQFKISMSQSQIDRLTREKDKLLDEYNFIKNSKVEVQTECPTCHRLLDPADIEKAKVELISLNSAKMSAIVKEGKEKAQEIEAEKQNLASLKTQIDEQEKELDKVSAEIKSMDELINKEPVEQVNPALESLKAEKEKLTADLNSMIADASKAEQEIATQIYELEQKKEPFNKIVDDANYFIRQSHEKDCCEKEKVAHEKELVQKEQMKDMLQKYIFTKLQMLDSNVSKVFGNIKFQLIKENINGGFDTVCKPYIYDPIKKVSSNVLWKSGSKSERVATGIAIAECIKKQLEFADLPYLFDEGGELSEDTIKTRLITNSQLICVKVQDNITSPLVIDL